ncbi:VOC family protein [Rhizobiaceae bacterium n13]|uniref:VOC family protein n=1 Tax=Ferirhizobium litorale TaxID=2927786 RepID=A0AAE3U5M9_9HYPH|nr:VOC family protein [Fererhizobium litorale]MDI7864252.1 VOC family protein [Fererhizobium litorale]MDI7924643.1 VOC family protein [Fererhizobium litorale]
MSSGIHHITLITRKVQANVDFYAGFLGLRLVKRTAGFEDAMQLHLFYGDAKASPGSLVTFLVWEDGAPGRLGHGQVGEISFAIDPASIGYWLTRALSKGIRMEGPVDEFGEPTLRLKDPDGVIVKLCGVNGMRPAAFWAGGGIPEEHAIGRIRGATLFTEVPEITEGFVADHFGYRTIGTAGTIRRMGSDSGDVVDIRDASGFWSSAPGTGTADHIAFRARDRDELQKVHAGLNALNSSVTSAHDRRYFYSLYVREPGGVLIELATDAPGMSVDEPEASLGTELFVPDNAQLPVDDVKVVLPQFAMPGEERVIYRDLPFVHRFFMPENPDDHTLVLLHGSGGSEASLMPLGHHVMPKSRLLGIRGRSTEEGIARWFRRYENMTFDQQDIRSEADAFAAFIEGAITAYHLDAERMTMIGQSNGANFLAAFLLLHPQAVRRAVLLRPMQVLEDPPRADLSGIGVLVVAGRDDPFSAEAPKLASLLSAMGAIVELREIAAGHEAAAADEVIAREWLAAQGV